MRQAAVRSNHAHLRSTLFAGCTLLGVFCLSSAASARPAAREGSTAYAQADAAVKRGDFAAAKAILAELWRTSPTFDVSASLADVELKLGDWVAAAEHARLALSQLPPSDANQYREAIQKVLDAAVAQVGILRISVTPAGAELLLDGLPTEPRPFVTPGVHEVRARLSGFEDASARVTVAQLQILPVTLKLDPSPGRSALGSWTATTATPAPVPVVSTQGPKRKPAESLVQSRDVRHPAVLVAGGLVTVGLGVGAAVMAVKANGDQSELRALALNPAECSTQNPSDVCIRGRQLETDTQDHRSLVVGLTAGAVGAVLVTGLTYWLWKDAPVVVDASPKALAIRFVHSF